jgi:integrase/recombinase XerC
MSIDIAQTIFGLPGFNVNSKHFLNGEFDRFLMRTISTPHTVQAYRRFAGGFLAWCNSEGLLCLNDIMPRHVVAWADLQGRHVGSEAVNQGLVALRHLFAWLLLNGLVLFNPAVSIRAPARRVKASKAAVLNSQDIYRVLEAIDSTTAVGLRDRAFIGFMFYCFADIPSALTMRVQDVYLRNRRVWIRLNKIGNKFREIKCCPVLEDYLITYLSVFSVDREPGSALFRSISRGSRSVGELPLPRDSALHIARQRALAVGIRERIGRSSFRLVAGVHIEEPKSDTRRE